MNQGQGEAAVPSPDPSARLHALPAVFAPGPAALVVPSNEQFQLVRAEAREAGKTHELHRTLSAMQAVAEKCDLAFDELVRLAVFRLQVERDLGAYLAQHIQRGGDRSNCPRGSLLRDGGVPDWVTHKQSASYQALAAIPEDVFQNYVETARGKHKVPSSRGAKAFADPCKPAFARAKRSPKTMGASPTATPKLLDACSRCLGDIDVLVGKAKVKAALLLEPKADLAKKLRGTVLVVDSLDPERTLRDLAKLVRGGVVEEALVVLPRDIDSAWLRSLGHGPWSCCIPHEEGPIVAHIGVRAHAFALVFAQFGIVLVVQSEAAGESS